MKILLTLYGPCPEGGHISIQNLESAQEQALDICGLGWTNKDEAAHVNAFSPIAFYKFPVALWIRSYN